MCAAEVTSGHEHPAAASDRADAIGADTTADADDQRIAAPGAQVGQAGSSGDLLSAHHPAGVSGQDLEHRPLLSSQALEGVSCY